MIGKKPKDLREEENFRVFVIGQFDLVNTILVMQQEFMTQMVVVYHCKNCGEQFITLLGLPDLLTFLETNQKINLKEHAIDTVMLCKCNFPAEVLAFIVAIYRPEAGIVILAKHLQLKKLYAFFTRVIESKGKIVGICPQYEEIPKEKYWPIFKRIFSLYP